MIQATRNEIAAAFGCMGFNSVRFTDGMTKVMLDDREATEAEWAVARFTAGKAAVLRSINDRSAAIIQGGYQHNFGSTAGIRTLDQRSTSDETAWLTVKMLAMDLVGAGAGDTPIAIRDASNDTFTCSASVANTAMSAMGAWRATVSARAWALKDEVQATADADSLAAIDIEAGWPE